MRERRIALVVLSLASVLVLAGCGTTTVETAESQDVGPSDTEVAVPQTETGLVPEEAEETEDEAVQPAPAPADPAPQPQSEEEALPDRVTYVCYDGLYSVDYDPRVFLPGPTGGADLVKDDGTEIFFARLSSPVMTETWLAGMEEKRQDQLYLSRGSYEEEAAGYPVKAIIYQDEAGWHAEAVAELGEDRGTPALPMYAIYFTARGPSQDAVWTDGVKLFLNTLRLGEG